MPAEFGEQHRADGNADNAERKLIEPVGIREHGDGVVGARGNDGAHENIDLGDAAGKDGRHRQHPEAAHLRVQPRQAKGGAKAGPLNGHPDQHQLRHSTSHGGDGDPDRGLGRGLDEPEGQWDQGSNGDQVEQHRREGGREEPPERVENGAIGGHQ